MENLDLVYSLFNQFIFQDAKNNIESLDYYFSTNPSTSDNTLVKGLLDAIKNYSFDTIDVPLFRSILVRDGKSQLEQQRILDDLFRWKSYDKSRMASTKEMIRDICASVIIQKANNRFLNKPYDFLKYLKSADIKIDNSDVLGSINFSNIDINSIMAEEGKNGYPSSWSWINDLFVPYGQYESGQMVMITMPPGCMSGDTEVFLSDGSIVTLEELHKRGSKNIPIFSWDPNEVECIKTTAESIQISKYVDSWYTVSIRDSVSGTKRTYHVTEDHPFLIIDKGWVRADKLESGDILRISDCRNESGSVWREYRIEESYLEQLSSPQPVYDLVEAGEHHNYSVNIDGTFGFFSHNTGKTLWMMTEALNMALSTKAKIHYLAMGDMKPRDFIVRMGAIYSGMPFGEVTKNLDGVYNTLRQFVGDRLEMSVIPAGQLTADEYVEYVMSKDYDVVFVDYDSNFKLKESESMYNDFGIVYNSLTKLTQEGKLVFVAAQPKVMSWINPVIELGDVGESSRKIHTADVLFTAGKYKDSPNHVGVFKCCKNRRGEEGNKTGYIRLNNGRFRFIPIPVAEQISDLKDKRDYTEQDIDEMIQRYNESMSNISRMSSVSQTPQKVRDPFNR